MNVTHWMNTHIRSVSPDDSLLKAWRTMTVYRIRHLPVVLEGALQGILSDRDIKKHALPVESGESVLLRQEHLEAIPVRHAMVRQVITVGPESSMERAAGTMTAHRIDSLPVVDGGRLVGLVTSTDVMNFLATHLEATDGHQLVSVAVDGEFEGLQHVLAALRTLRPALPNMLFKRAAAGGPGWLTVTLPAADARRLAQDLGSDRVHVEAP